ncbi:hypothetical protein J3Q64DRAFT_1706634 [Phycomyces blakesleeanus]
MLASELPFDILRNIGRFLWLPDQLESCLVCRTWRIPFQDSLWDVITFKQFRMFDKMLDVSDRAHESYQQNGYRVRELSIHSEISISDQRFLAFQKYFPNIICLFISDGHLNKTTLVSVANWNLWGKTLTDLKIHSMDWEYANQADTLLDISLQLPNLKSLIVTLFCGNTPALMTFDQLESFHSNMPLLERLVLDMNLADFGNEEYVLSRILNVKPAMKLKHLQFNFFHSFYQWLCYFAIKYPSLQTIRRTNDFGEEDYVQHPKERHIVSHLYPPAFQYLESIDMTPTNTKQLHLDIWKQMYLLGTKLKHIKLNLHERVEMDCLDAMIKECMNLFSKTLETFHFCGNADGPQLSNFTAHIDFFPVLVHLDISSSNTLIELDVLLDRCVSLKLLRVEDCKILLSTKEYETPKSHGLRMLCLLYAITTCNLLEYLSVRCRRLNYILLGLSEIYGEHSNSSSRIDIDMSYTHIKYIPSESKFISPSKRKRERCAGDADYIILSQTSSPCPIVSNVSTHFAWDLYSDTITKDVWYFAGYNEYYGMDGYTVEQRIMTEEDITTVAKILRKQECGNINTIDEKDKYFGFDMVPKEWCTEDINLTYAVIRCGNISNDYIPHETMSDREVMERLYTTF